MEGQQTEGRYREPKTVYSFSVGAQALTQCGTLVLVSGRHASAFALTHVTGPAVQWRVTATKGESKTTSDYAEIYPHSDHWVAVLTSKASEEMAYAAITFALESFHPGKVLTVASILEGEYIGQGTGVRYLANSMARGIVPEDALLEPGNVLRGVAAASVLQGEVKGVPAASVSVIVPDHVLSSSICKLFEQAPLLRPLLTSGQYSKGIATVENRVYSHNIYS